MTQQTPNRVAQHAHQMQSAEQPTNHIAQQLAMMTNTASMASPQKMPAVDQQVDWNAKIAEVMREQFGLRPKQQSVMYKTPSGLQSDSSPAQVQDAGLHEVLRSGRSLYNGTC